MQNTREKQRKKNQQKGLFLVMQRILLRLFFVCVSTLFGLLVQAEADQGLPSHWEGLDSPIASAWLAEKARPASLSRRWREIALHQQAYWQAQNMTNGTIWNDKAMDRATLQTYLREKAAAETTPLKFDLVFFLNFFATHLAMPALLVTDHRSCRRSRNTCPSFSTGFTPPER